MSLDEKHSIASVSKVVFITVPLASSVEIHLRGEILGSFVEVSGMPCRGGRD